MTPTHATAATAPATRDPAFDLDGISVRTPCKASWEAMRGDDRVRFCASCRKNVYDLGALSRAEAEALVFRSEGKVCARFHRRADGTVATADCAEGRTTRRGARRERAARVGAALLAIASVLGAQGCGASQNGILRHSRARQWPVVGALLEWIDPTPQVMMAGKICLPTPTPTPVPVATTGTTPPVGTTPPPVGPAPSTVATPMLGEVAAPARPAPAPATSSQ